MFKGDPSQELFSFFPVIFQISYHLDDKYSGQSQVLKIRGWGLYVVLWWFDREISSDTKQHTKQSIGKVRPLSLA